MNIAGKLAGAFFGYLLTGGSFWGAILGFYFGSMFDRGLAQGDFIGGFHSTQGRQRIQQVFFKTLFTSSFRPSAIQMCNPIPLSRDSTVLSVYY